MGYEVVVSFRHFSAHFIELSFTDDRTLFLFTGQVARFLLVEVFGHLKSSFTNEQHIISFHALLHHHLVQIILGRLDEMEAPDLPRSHMLQVGNLPEEGHSCLQFLCLYLIKDISVVFFLD